MEPDYRKHVAQNRINFIERCVLEICVFILLGGLAVGHITPNIIEIRQFGIIKLSKKLVI